MAPNLPLIPNQDIVERIRVWMSHRDLIPADLPRILKGNWNPVGIGRALNEGVRVRNLEALINKLFPKELGILLLEAKKDIPRSDLGGRRKRRDPNEEGPPDPDLVKIPVPLSAARELIDVARGLIAEHRSDGAEYPRKQVFTPDAMWALTCIEKALALPSKIPSISNLAGPCIPQSLQKPSNADVIYIWVMSYEMCALREELHPHATQFPESFPWITAESELLVSEGFRPARGRRGRKSKKANK